MKKNKPVAIACPVSVQRVDENAVRFVAAYALIIALVSVMTANPFPVIFLAADFALRAFTDGFFSPLRQLARFSVKTLGLKPAATDAAPKKFAAGVGLLFSAVIAFGIITGLRPVYIPVAIILVTCAVLESVFAYCVGCVVYSLLQKFFPAEK